MRILSLLFVLILTPSYVWAQCAMCRTQVVNNANVGDTSFAESLNFGILYLFLTPYIVLGVVAYFWFRKSKKGYKRNLAS